MSRPSFEPALCLVIGPEDTLGRDLMQVTERALRGGVTMVQLRWKHAPTQPLLALARRLQTVTSHFRVPLLLNDRVDLVEAAGAQGAHIGQSDTSVAEARAQLGPQGLLGLSIEHAEQLRGVDTAAVDYLGVGPIFATATKPDHAPPLGIEGLARVRALTSLPILAIGGVGSAHAQALRRAGADGLAVVSAICAAPDPEQAARTLRGALATQN